MTWSKHLISSRSSHGVLPFLLALAFSACHAAPRPAVAPAPPGSGRVVQLQHDIDAVLAAPALARGYWGVEVKSLGSNETLYALNVHKLLMPASTLKILTLAAAAERLGWEYTYETRLLAAGTIDSGVLNGDLLVIGSGDPSIVDRDGIAARAFDTWSDALKGAGIRIVTGRIIGDDNAFDDEGLGQGWSWDDLTDGFAAGVGALQYNENRVQVTVTPGAAGGAPAAVTLTPGGSGLIVDNLVKTTETGRAAIAPRRLPGSSRLDLRGSIGRTSAPAVLSVSVDNPTLFFVTALRDHLSARGIDVRGPAVDIDDVGDAPSRSNAIHIATHRSQPLSTMMTTPFKFSLNLYEETLLKTMGALAGTPTFQGGIAAEESALQAWGVQPSEIVQVDGSGLSRYNYMTVDALVSVLSRVDRDEMLRGPFEMALPIAGRDGTLAARLKGTPAEGNARAKTGTMANVRALAGYVTSADGEGLVFAILANNFGTTPDMIIAAIDAIVVKLAEFKR